MIVPQFAKRVKGSVARLSKRQVVRNFTGVVGANLIATVISLALALFVPKLLPVADYSYWQLYVFYLAYVGILHFGIADGIYLRYGGAYYEKLDKRLIGTQFWLMFVLQVVIAGMVVAIAQNFTGQPERALIFSLIGVGLVLVNMRTFLQMLLQTTNRMVDFSKNLIFERITYVVLVAATLIVGYRDFYYLIYADLLAKFIMLLLLVVACRDIVLSFDAPNRDTVRDLIRNLSAGVKLMLANLAGILIVGGVRLVVEARWDVETFGRLALILTATNLVLVFVSAAGLVTYPLIKRASVDKLAVIYADIRTVLVAVMLGFLLCYFPLHWALELWLPQYSEGFVLLALLFPLCFFEAKSQILTNTYLKALRQESKLFIINLSAMMLSIILAYIAAFAAGSLPLTILVILVGLSVKSLLSEYAVGQHLRVTGLLKNNTQELTLVMVFIASCWFISQYAVVIYLGALSVYLALKHTEVKYALKRTFMH